MNKKIKCMLYFEVMFALSLFILFIVIFHSFNFFEVLYEYTREHESWQLDEIISAVIAFGLTCFFVSIHHILFLKHLILELEETSEQLLVHERDLMRKEKMIALGNLAGGLAHEINNALQPTIGLGGFIRKELSEHSDKKYLKYMDIILDSTQHANRIIENVLLFASDKNIEMNNINAYDAISSSIKFCQDLIPSTITIKVIGIPKVISDREIPQILCNQTSLHQIFYNLIKNSANSLNLLGTIDITVLESKMPEDSSETPSICIKISDKGCGIDEENIDRIFDPFFTTKDLHEGTGLGLTIVHSLIKKHNANISVTSEQNKGTTFILNFPITNYKNNKIDRE